VHIDLGQVRLRKPEPSDVDALFVQKNDPENQASLGGFTTGYTRADLTRWVERHGGAKDETLFVIVGEGERVLGHVGLYEIDHRIRSAVFGILLGDKSARGKGIGFACTKWAVDYGFSELNLHRVTLEVLETNTPAKKIYDALGFKVEGRFRHAQYRGGKYLDVIAMAILEDEWKHRGG
jgi:RimJ/RimL family protein N-acetyltransferase